MPKLSSQVMESRKNHITDSAFKLFSEKGFSNTSMDDIVKKSGVSKGGIYNYFQSKEEIFLEIAERRLNGRRDLMASINNKESVSDFMRTYLKAVLFSLETLETLMTAKFSFEFWAVLSRNPIWSEKAKKRYYEFYKDLEEILILGVERGEFDPNLDIENMCYVILATLDGMMHTYAVMGIDISDQSIEQYSDMVISKLRGACK